MTGLNGIRTHNLAIIGAMLYPLSYQANWRSEMGVRNILDDGELACSRRSVCGALKKNRARKKKNEAFRCSPQSKRLEQANGE